MLNFSTFFVIFIDIFAKFAAIMKTARYFFLYFFVLSCLICISCCTSCSKKAKATHQKEHTELVDIDFDDGLGKGERAFHLVLKSHADQKRHRLLKKMWEQNRLSHTRANPDGKIPKIIHQIWLGPKRPPRYFYTFRQTWESTHPDWEYKLWTDADAQNFDFELKDLYNASSNWGEKSDILRCEILLAFGGMYADVDFECIQSFDELVKKYDFFAGIEPPHAIAESDHVLLTSNALIGSVPHHPILKRWKETIRSRWQKAEEECFSPVEKVLVRTFLPFGEAVDMEIEAPGYTNIVFPSTYFYPLKPLYVRNPPKEPGGFKKALIACGVKTGHPFSEIKKESMAVHYFATSWQKSANELIKDIHKELVKIKKNQALLEQEIAALKAPRTQEQVENNA